MFKKLIQNNSLKLLRAIVFAGMFSVCLPVLAAGQCKGESVMRSQNSNTATEISFINQSRGEVSIYWIDFAGKRVFYNRLRSGEGYVQQTYLTHPWVAINARGQCSGPFMPASSKRTIQID